MSLYKYDTHVHTSETSYCGNISGAELTHLYKNEGYKGLIITDHYFSGFFQELGQISWEEKVEIYLKGYRSALNEGQKIGINILLGLEIKFDENANDYLVYGIDKAFLNENAELYKLGLSKFKKLAQDNNILIYQAHPFRTTVTPANPKFLDGVEVFNGNKRHNSYNSSAQAFAASNNLKTISGSDFHELEDLATGGIILPEAPKSSSEFVKILNDNNILQLLYKLQ